MSKRKTRRLRRKPSTPQRTPTRPLATTTSRALWPKMTTTPQPKSPMTTETASPLTPLPRLTAAQADAPMEIDRDLHSDVEPMAGENGDVAPPDDKDDDVWRGGERSADSDDLGWMELLYVVNLQFTPSGNTQYLYSKA